METFEMITDELTYDIARHLGTCMEAFSKLTAVKVLVRRKGRPDKYMHMEKGKWTLGSVTEELLTLLLGMNTLVLSEV